jgi:hypothetical protein
MKRVGVDFSQHPRTGPARLAPARNAECYGFVVDSVNVSVLL